MSDAAHLTTWVTRETKTRFATVARHQGISDSALLKRLIDTMLQAGHAGNGAATSGRAGRVSRFSIRLRPDDQILLRERAAARGMPAATYVSVLTRAHLRSLSPLPKEELLALRRTVSELGSFGRNLNQIARAANQGERTGGPSREDLRAILRVAKAFEITSRDCCRPISSPGSKGMPSQAYSEAPFDLLSYARRGPGRRDHLSPGEIHQVARTVRRTPEVMVKVLPKPANTLARVRKHLSYIGRRGELDLKTDDGERLRSTRVGNDLVEDWDLDLDEYRRKADLTATRGKEPPRLVHKVIFSMPAGTPPEKVLMAVKNFAREEFALKHRYVLALHTDTPRPHVHVVVKAVSEQGQRLHIRKATLREWRSGFAHHLRALGVAANATPRYVRGENNLRKPDGIYRASLRGESTYMRERAEASSAQGNPTSRS
jgi:hypothetical protein